MLRVVYLYLTAGVGAVPQGCGSNQLAPPAAGLRQARRLFPLPCPPAAGTAEPGGMERTPEEGRIPPLAPTQADSGLKQ